MDESSRANHPIRMMTRLRGGERLAETRRTPSARIDPGGLRMVLAADYPFLDVLWTMIVFFLWVAWFMLLFHVHRRRLPPPRRERREEDALADLCALRPVPRRLRLPDRQQRRHGGTELRTDGGISDVPLARILRLASPPRGAALQAQVLADRPEPALAARSDDDERRRVRRRLVRRPETHRPCSTAWSRPGTTATCTSWQGTSARRSSSPTSARPPGRRCSRRTVIPSATAAGSGCTTAPSGTSIA